MKSVNFKFNLDQKVKAASVDFIGIITMCAIQGDPANPEIVYYVQGEKNCFWYAERLLTEAV
jgi:hypothetical protein